jgi:hypothetical protein
VSLPLKWLFVHQYPCPPTIFSHFYRMQGIVLLIILISGLMCMMGIDTPSRFEAPLESWSHFNTDQVLEPDEAQVLSACTVDIYYILPPFSNVCRPLVHFLLKNGKHLRTAGVVSFLLETLWIQWQSFGVILHSYLRSSSWATPAVSDLTLLQVVSVNNLEFRWSIRWHCLSSNKYEMLVCTSSEVAAHEQVSICLAFVPHPWSGIAVHSIWDLLAEHLFRANARSRWLLISIM